MGLLSQSSAGSTQQQATSSGGLLQRAGATTLEQARIQPKVATKKQPEEKKEVKGFSIGEIGKALKGGLSTVPGRAATAGGIVLDSLVQTARNAQYLRSKTLELQERIQPEYARKISQSKRQQIALETGLIEKLRKPAQKLRDIGVQSEKKALEKYTKEKAPTKGAQNFFEQVAFNVPQMLASFGLTAATAALTKNPAATVAVATGTGYGLGASEVYSQARQKGQSDKQSLQLAKIGGALMAPLEAVGPTTLGLSKFATESVKKSIAKELAAEMSTIGLTAIVEGGTEGLQQIVQNALEKTYNKNKNVLEGVKESAFVGAFLGAGADVVLSSIAGGKPEELDAQVAKAIEKKPDARTTEEKLLVMSLLDTTYSPDEAFSLVVEQELSDTPTGKELMKKSLEARATGQDIRVLHDEQTGTVNIELIEPSVMSEQQISEPDEDLLVQEARKYKSAEEFVKAQGQPLYHGTNADFKVFDKAKIGSATDEGLFGKGFYFGNSESFARVAPRGRLAKNVMEVYPSADANIFDIAKVKSKAEMANLLNMSEDALIQDDNGIIRPIRGQVEQFTSHLQDLGYDGVVVKRGADAVETVIFEPSKIKTKSQLTDIWNEANKKPQLDKEADDSLLTSKEAEIEAQKDTERARSARKELTERQQDIEQSRAENEVKKQELDRFTTSTIKAMRMIKRSMDILEEKGLDITNVSKMKAYQNSIDNVMSELGTTSEDEALRYIREDLPDTITPVTTRQEQEEMRVLKSRIQPKEISVSKEQLPVGQGKPRASRLEARMKGVIGKATPEQIEELGLTTYNTLNKKETIARAAEYVTENRSEAVRVLEGKAEAPEGIPKTALYVALTQQAKGDLTLATKLASLQATRLGQEISILTELDPDSPVKIMNEIVEFRRAQFEKRYKGRSEEQVKKSIVEKMKKSVKKPSRAEWNEFINSIEC